MLNGERNISVGRYLMDKYKFGAKEVCLKCEEPKSFYPADGKEREARALICKECMGRIKDLMIRMGKLQYWTKK